MNRKITMEKLSRKLFLRYNIPSIMSNKVSIGIVGLPNVGKSTLFNALLKKSVADVANYPFCTIEPNVGIIEVPDERLTRLAEIVNIEKIVPAVVEFYDIAGLVKNASKGEGLGNQFLSHIREVSAIIHVVRLFEDQEIIHVDKEYNPNNDIATVETELILADLQTLAKQKEPKINASKEEKAIFQTVLKLKQILNTGIPARKINLSDDEKKQIQSLHLLTIKPVIFLFNVSETQLEKKQETEENIKIIMHAIDTNAQCLYLCVKMENDMVSLGLTRLIQQAYQTLGLISFLTAGIKEVRAWTIPVGTNAPQAASVIHSDFEKHFIRADVARFEDFIECKGWTNTRELGKVKTVGRDYIMKEGDVIDFKVRPNRI